MTDDQQTLSFAEYFERYRPTQHKEYQEALKKQNPEELVNRIERKGDLDREVKTLPSPFSRNIQPPVSDNDVSEKVLEYVQSLKPISMDPDNILNFMEFGDHSKLKELHDWDPNPVILTKPDKAPDELVRLAKRTMYDYISQVTRGNTTTSRPKIGIVDPGPRMWGKLSEEVVHFNNADKRLVFITRDNIDQYTTKQLQNSVVMEDDMNMYDSIIFPYTFFSKISSPRLLNIVVTWLSRCLTPAGVASVLYNCGYMTSTSFNVASYWFDPGLYNSVWYKRSDGKKYHQYLIKMSALNDAMNAKGLELRKVDFNEMFPDYHMASSHLEILQIVHMGTGSLFLPAEKAIPISFQQIHDTIKTEIDVYPRMEHISYDTLPEAIKIETKVAEIQSGIDGTGQVHMDDDTLVLDMKIPGNYTSTDSGLEITVTRIIMELDISKYSQFIGATFCIRLVPKASYSKEYYATCGPGDNIVNLQGEDYHVIIYDCLTLYKHTPIARMTWLNRVMVGLFDTVAFRDITDIMYQFQLGLEYMFINPWKTRLKKKFIYYYILDILPRVRVFKIIDGEHWWWTLSLKEYIAHDYSHATKGLFATHSENEILDDQILLEDFRDCIMAWIGILGDRFHEKVNITQHLGTDDVNEIMYSNEKKTLLLSTFPKPLMVEDDPDNQKLEILLDYRSETITNFIQRKDFTTVARDKLHEKVMREMNPYKRWITYSRDKKYYNLHLCSSELEDYDINKINRFFLPDVPPFFSTRYYKRPDEDGKIDYYNEYGEKKTCFLNRTQIYDNQQYAFDDDECRMYGYDTFDEVSQQWIRCIHENRHGYSHDTV